MVFALIFLPKIISKRLFINTDQTRFYRNLPNSITRKLREAPLYTGSLSYKFILILDVQMTM